MVTYMIPYVVAVVCLSSPISQTSVVLQLTCNQQKRHLLTKWLTLKFALGLLRLNTKENQKLTYFFIYLFVVYFNDLVSISGHTMPKYKVIDWGNRRGCGRKLTWPSSKYAYQSETCLQGSTKTTKNIIRDSRSLDRNSNQAQSEYKSKPLPGEPIYWANLQTTYSWSTLPKFGDKHTADMTHNALTMRSLIPAEIMHC